MQWEEQEGNFREVTTRSSYHLVKQSDKQQARSQPGLNAFGIYAETPPPTDPLVIMQRADEINTIQRMLNDAHASAVMIIGFPGAGKSTLAALLYRRLQLAKEANLPAPRHIVWLTLGTYTALPDMIAAILNGVGVNEPGFYLLKPEQQISTLLRALRRQQENALVVLDQFESLLYPETELAKIGRGVLPLFLDMLQTDLGTSRILLTSYDSPFEDMEETRVRSYMVSRISIPEGLALLQQRGVQGSPEELSLVWQRCSGQVFSLVLFCALVRFSGISLSYLLNAPDYKSMWAGEVNSSLIAQIYYFLNPAQLAIIRALSLFIEPAPFEGIMMIITHNGATPIPESNTTSYGLFERELQILAQFGLIQLLVNTAGNTCYLLHPLLRQHVLEHYLENGKYGADAHQALGVNSLPGQLTTNPESLNVAVAAGHMKVASYYKYVIQQYCPPREQRQVALDLEPVLAAVRHLCFAWRWQQACELLFAEELHERLVQLGALNTLLGLYAFLLPPFGSLERHDEGLVLSQVAMLCGRMGDYQQAMTLFEQALAIQRQIADRKGEASTLANQGELLRMCGEFEHARQNFEQALLLNRQQDLALQCILLHNLGLIYQYERDYAHALSCYSESLKLAYKLPGQYDRGLILTNLGLLLYEQGQHQEALAILLAALDLRRMLHDPGVTLLIHFLGALEQKMGTGAYMTACQHALEMQRQVFSRFVGGDMRQY